MIKTADFADQVQQALKYVNKIVVESDGYPMSHTAADIRTLLTNAYLSGMEAALAGRLRAVQEEMMSNKSAEQVQADSLRRLNAITGDRAETATENPDSRVAWKRRADTAEATVKSLAMMLGWENVPPRETLERSIAALNARLRAVEADNAQLNRLLSIAAEKAHAAKEGQQVCTHCGFTPTEGAAHRAWKDDLPAAGVVPSPQLLETKDDHDDDHTRVDRR